MIAKDRICQGLVIALGAVTLHLLQLDAAYHAEIGLGREIFSTLGTIVNLQNMMAAGRTESGIKVDFGKALGAL